MNLGCYEFGFYEPRFSLPSDVNVCKIHRFLRTFSKNCSYEKQLIS